MTEDIENVLMIRIQMLFDEIMHLRERIAIIENTLRKLE